MLLTQKNGLSYLQFKSFKNIADIRHGIFTRVGGLSVSSFDSLNVGFNVGDLPERVEENRKRIAGCMGEGLVFIHQVHGTNIWRLFENNPVDLNQPPQADAIISNLKGKSLVIQVADCQALLLFDPAKKVVANVHSGWRGKPPEHCGANGEGDAG